MSETRAMLIEAASRLFTDLCTRAVHADAARGVWPAELWAQIEAVGLAATTRSEARGGSGATFGDACALVRSAGVHAIPVPLAETLLAESALEAAGLVAGSGPLTIAPVLRSDRVQLVRKAGRWSVSGTLHRVPWGRDAAALVIVTELDDRPTTLQLEPPRIERHDKNYAHEPRDDVRLDDVQVPDAAVGEPGRGWSRDDLYFQGALYRAQQMAGAMERVLESTVRYAQERVAFGRPIGKFQAVQQNIAVLATQVAAASAAAQAAADAAARSPAQFEIAAAKARVGESAGIAAAIAHQVHAAMGFTHEHALHLITRRLWSWRDEFGAEPEWLTWVGRAAAQVGGEGLWAFLVEQNKAVPAAIPRGGKV